MPRLGVLVKSFVLIQSYYLYRVTALESWIKRKTMERKTENCGMSGILQFRLLNADRCVSKVW